MWKPSSEKKDLFGLSELGETFPESDVASNVTINPKDRTIEVN